MKVFLLRHTEAVYGMPDPERHLSEYGARMADRLAQLIAPNPYYAFTEIWSSPYVRARQTAEPFIQGLADPQSFIIKDTLRPGSDHRRILVDLQSCQSSVLLVGHNPHLATLATSMLGLDASGCSLSFKKGALFIFRREAYSDSGFSLAASLPPAALGLKEPACSRK